MNSLQTNLFLSHNLSFFAAWSRTRKLKLSDVAFVSSRYQRDSICSLWFHARIVRVMISILEAREGGRLRLRGLGDQPAWHGPSTTLVYYLLTIIQAPVSN